MFSLFVIIRTLQPHRPEKKLLLLKHLELPVVGGRTGGSQEPGSQGVCLGKAAASVGFFNLREHWAVAWGHRGESEVLLSAWSLFCVAFGKFLMGPRVTSPWRARGQEEGELERRSQRLFRSCQ